MMRFRLRQIFMDGRVKPGHDEWEKNGAWLALGAHVL